MKKSAISVNIFLHLDGSSLSLVFKFLICILNDDSDSYHLKRGSMMSNVSYFNMPCLWMAGTIFHFNT